MRVLKINKEQVHKEFEVSELSFPFTIGDGCYDATISFRDGDVDMIDVWDIDGNHREHQLADEFIEQLGVAALKLR